MLITIDPHPTFSLSNRTHCTQHAINTIAITWIKYVQFTLKATTVFNREKAKLFSRMQHDKKKSNVLIAAIQNRIQNRIHRIYISHENPHRKKCTNLIKSIHQCASIYKSSFVQFCWMGSFTFNCQKRAKKDKNTTSINCEHTFHTWMLSQYCQFFSNTKCWSNCSKQMLSVVYFMVATKR